MRLLYTLGIALYGAGIWLWSFWSPKAKNWRQGRKHLFQDLKTAIAGRPALWFHCASLGEFEQGRPVLEHMRRLHPELAIVLSFFSPSGYLMRKNTTLADFVTYMPLDTPAASRRFVMLLNPKLVVFVKYEVWHNHLHQLFRQNIPVYLISAKFRRSQVYFRPYGKWFARSLRRMAHIFVQDRESLDLTAQLGLTNVSISGDTRFDRVWHIAQNHQSVEGVAAFCAGSTVVVAGSTWPPDEELLCRYINQAGAEGANLKFIIAPHEVHEAHLSQIEQRLEKPVVRLSQMAGASQVTILLIDSIGLLSRIYQYATVAYIGGGFGVGIHNLLEPAAFGVPVVFGPEYHRFKEAHDLLARHAGSSIRDFDELARALHRYTATADGALAGARAQTYVKENTGATTRILKGIT